VISRCVTVAVAIVVHSVLVDTVAAQPAGPGMRHRFEVSLGGLWIGGAPLGSDVAELRANRVPADSFTLFTTDSRTEAAPGFDAKVSYWLTRSIAVEAGFVRVQPELRTRVGADPEGAAAFTAVEKVDQYFIDAGVVWLVNRLRFRERTVPFVSGGAGYLRQLHEGRTLVETGQVYHAGGGVRHTLLTRDRGVIRRMGLRVDARAYVLVDGVQLEERPRTHAAFSGAVFVAF
jgi:hypothetical protein